jgi:hypothetical protein
MRDVTCSHCGEPWDVDYLRHDSIGSWEPGQVDVLAPLGSAEPAISYLVSRDERDLPQLVEQIAEDPYLDRPSDQPLTVAELFDYWNNNTAVEPDAPAMKAAKLIVETAVYSAVLSGRGCPTCGFTHEGRGEHRETTLRELVHGGVTDDDPAAFIRADE